MLMLIIFQQVVFFVELADPRDGQHVLRQLGTVALTELQLPPSLQSLALP